MKRLLLGAGFALIASAALADPADGIWKTEKGEDGGFLHVQIAECGAKICGTIVKGFDKNSKDDPAYEHLGKQLVWNMTAKGGGVYKGGTIWAPDTDKKYSSKMKLNGSTLKVSGCVFGGLICRSQTWTRIK